MKKSYDLYSDPGHAWVKVPKKILRQLNIADKITPFSYMKGDNAYLEEDLDAGTFLKAMRASDHPAVLREHFTNQSSRVRGYDHYYLSEED